MIASESTTTCSTEKHSLTFTSTLSGGSRTKITRTISPQQRQRVSAVTSAPMTVPGTKRVIFGRRNVPSPTEQNVEASRAVLSRVAGRTWRRAFKGKRRVASSHIFCFDDPRVDQRPKMLVQSTEWRLSKSLNLLENAHGLPSPLLGTILS